MLSIKEIKLLVKNKKARDSQGLFVTEGRKLFGEAPRDRIVQVLMTASYEKAHPDIKEQLKGVDVIGDMEDGRFASVSDTKSPQGIMTIIRREDKTPREILENVTKEAPCFLLLENLQDPGNAGTMIRTAEAAGVDAVFLTKGSVDLYSPKTIRSTMGSIYRVPHAYAENMDELLELMRQRQVTTYAAHLRGDRYYSECAFEKACALIIGNEGNGITEETAKRADVLMKIPMEGKVESLNAAMAAGILMYEVHRVRS